MLALSLPFGSADAFFQGIKATFNIKNLGGKRRDIGNAENDKNIYLFLETGKSAVAIT